MDSSEFRPDGYWLIETPVEGRVQMFRRMKVGGGPGQFDTREALERATQEYLDDVIAHPEGHLNSEGRPLALIERVPVETQVVGAFIADGRGGWASIDVSLTGTSGPHPRPGHPGWREPKAVAAISLKHVEGDWSNAPLGPQVSVSQTVESVAEALEAATQIQRMASDEARAAADNIDHLDSEGWMITPPPVSCVIVRSRFGESEPIVIPSVGEIGG
jgi:hypothetical protein